MFRRYRDRSSVVDAWSAAPNHESQTLLARHPQSQAGSGHALLGQELSPPAALSLMELTGISARSDFVRGDQTLLSAAERIAARERSRPIDRDRGGEPQPVNQRAPGIDTRVLSSPNLGNPMPGVTFFGPYRA